MSNVHRIIDFIDKKRRSSTNFTEDEPELPLQFGGGGGTFEGMDAIDAKIAAAEARTDTKFAELRGYLKDFSTKATVWGAMGTAVALILGTIAFGGDRFDAGIGMSDSLRSQAERDAKQDKAVQQINDKLDRLIEAQEARKR